MTPLALQLLFKGPRYQGHAGFWQSESGLITRSRCKMHVRCVVSACVRVAIVLSLLFIRQRQNKRLPSAAPVPVTERKRSIWHTAQTTLTHSRDGDSGTPLHQPRPSLCFLTCGSTYLSIIKGRWPGVCGGGPAARTTL